VFYSVVPHGRGLIVLFFWSFLLFFGLFFRWPTPEIFSADALGHTIIFENFEVVLQQKVQTSESEEPSATSMSALDNPSYPDYKDVFMKGP